jgi:hypothetical protein
MQMKHFKYLELDIHLFTYLFLILQLTTLSTAYDSKALIGMMTLNNELSGI